MLLTKFLINAVATKLAKHFRLEKIMNYVFDDNELDKEVKSINNRIKIIEAVITTNKCSCKGD